MKSVAYFRLKPKSIDQKRIANLKCYYFLIKKY
jgi:hypothetical protein